MTFIGQDPGFRCLDGAVRNESGQGYGQRNTTGGGGFYDSQCELDNTSSLASYNYDPRMVTIVSEMGGLLVGGLISGQFADTYGRKPTFILSVFLISAFNLSGYFSVNWEMYAAMRFLIGVAVGAYVTVQYSLMNEFATVKWRPVIVVTPSFSIQASMFALLAWMVHDWRKIHLATEAETVIHKLARVNRKPVPDLTKVMDAARMEETKESRLRRYTGLYLFRCRDSLKTTVGLLIVWFSTNFGYFGITFGIRSLSGDLYMNMFLINIVEAPYRSEEDLHDILQFGGHMWNSDSPLSGTVTNGIALVAKIGVASGMQSLMLYTSEIYPTVVRTIAYSVHSTAARVGSMVAPQVVFLDEAQPGLLYFVSGMLMILSAFIMIILRETKGLELQDMLEEIIDEGGLDVNITVVNGNVNDDGQYDRVSVDARKANGVHEDNQASVATTPETMTYNVLLEDIVRQTGGCGLYQWLLCLIVHTGKTISSWSLIAMTFIGQDPGFRCLDGAVRNESGQGYGQRNTTGGEGFYDSQCELDNTTSLASYNYDPRMVTIVSEYDLVCGRKWIPAMITTIQMGGVLVGCLISGQFADTYGRKPTFFVSVFLISAFNLSGYFSVNWEMYTGMRFLIGVAVGAYVTVQYSLMNEFATVKWRPVIVVTPSFSIQASLFALLAWMVHDWRKIHLATIARVNRKPVPDLTKVMDAARMEETKESRLRRYTCLDLFRSRDSLKTTVGLLIVWFSTNFGYIGITFGIRSLSGDLYMNMFLVNIVEAPVQIIVALLVNCFGRKKTCMIFYSLAGMSGIAVGVLQYADSPLSGTVTNVIALVAKIGVASALQSLMLFTSEIYPTVVRTIAYSVHSMAARAGSMVAPQVVFLDEAQPGLLYFVSGILMILSAFIMIIFRETKGLELQDTLEEIIDEGGLDVNVTVGNGGGINNDGQYDRMSVDARNANGIHEDNQASVASIV
ncbi:S22A5-like protein [Mya arenaria]|uniref:S22A5-like protein n=1 Tax=Mya arenaria TaxID=6604 RepID=A0ABY7DNS8_MYAAR|nr:S22A5-like protein [Mya arenaria]